MRRSLVLGIDDYTHLQPLSGCTADAAMMTDMLTRNADGSPNFDVRVLTSASTALTRSEILRGVERLFASPADVALLYFSGHGTYSGAGGYLVPTDATSWRESVSMREILTLADGSPIGETIIILDCCHSGAFGNMPEQEGNHSLLREGSAILAASRPAEPASETSRGGLFTGLVVEALRGSAADVLGRVTISSVYAHVDQSLGAWHQRPVFKAHLTKFAPIRRTTPHVDPSILRLLPSYFPRDDHQLPLDPSFEPELEPHDERNERTFAHLQTLRDARLLVPVGETHLYHAALHSKACELTSLGRHYWQLAKAGRI